MRADGARGARAVRRGRLAAGLLGLGVLAAGAAAPPPGRAAPPALEAAAAVADYCAAWSETAPAARAARLERAFAPDGLYLDPAPTRARGRAALAAAIAAFQRRVPGARLSCGAPQAHHGVARVSWSIRTADGAPLVHGVDLDDFGPDGRIVRVVGFFGEAPPAAP